VWPTAAAISADALAPSLSLYFSSPLFFSFSHFLSLFFSFPPFLSFLLPSPSSLLLPPSRTRQSTGPAPFPCSARLGRATTPLAPAPSLGRSPLPACSSRAVTPPPAHPAPSLADRRAVPSHPEPCNHPHALAALGCATPGPLAAHARCGAPPLGRTRRTPHVSRPPPIPCARTPPRPPLTPYRRRRPRHSDACSGRRLPEASRRLAEPRPPLTPAPTAIISAAGLRRIPPSRHRLSTAIKASPPAPHPRTQTSLATTASPPQR